MPAPAHVQLRLPAWPHFEEEDLEAVERVLRSGRINYWTGEEGRLFEREYAAYVGTRHAVSVSNGTVALELALRALGIGPGDEVIVPARTFIATASSVAMVGATPVFADVDRNTQNITAEAIRPCITSRTRALIVVHLAGCPCDLDPVLDLAREHRLKVVEDCAQAHGARYRGRPVGSIGAIGAFSFCQDKIISTGGEGGMLTLNDNDGHEFLLAFRDHGKRGDTRQSLGTNARLTEIQSALGRSCLRRLDDSVRLRRRNAETLIEALRPYPALSVPVISPDLFHAYYKLYCFVRPSHLGEGWTRDRLVSELVAAGVPCSSGGLRPVPHEPFFSPVASSRNWPNAEELAATSLMFLVHPTLKTEHMEAIAAVTCSILQRAVGPFF